MYNILVRQRGVFKINDNKKIKKPIDDLKLTRVTVRLDKETNEKLEEFCKKNNLSKSEGVREALKGLK